MNHAFWGAPNVGYLKSTPPNPLPAPQRTLSSQAPAAQDWNQLIRTWWFGPISLFLVPCLIAEVSSQNSSLPTSPCTTGGFLVGGAQKPLTVAVAHGPPLLQKYVQDVLQEQLAESVYRALKEQGGHIYVCGDVTMAADVLKAIQRIMTQQGKLSEEDAGVFISRLRVSDSSQHPEVSSLPTSTSNSGSSI